ncbi:MAG: PhzF family phenazine biosynthesis protein [Bacteroidales bacterium]|jgi:PhzF family phenazine biosynthesis protein|nr:PhzF family phenazine biosynthesis protein [Bacteroidales bacterium]
MDLNRNAISTPAKLANKIKLYQVDAFTNKLFSGNPAAVCILDTWLSDELMQLIGNENNLAETAFIVPKEQYFEIRWFTPTVEVDLCGHATLASAFVLFNILNYSGSLIKFFSHRSGWLFAEKRDSLVFLNFPTDALTTLTEQQSKILEKCIGIKPIESYKGKTDYIAVINTETSLQNLQPNLIKIAKLKARALIVTAKGTRVDFVSRVFAPQSGINEDPVTGSAHTSLIPLWSAKLGKKNLIAKQISSRGGNLVCEFENERCLIGGEAKLYLTGEINIV